MNADLYAEPDRCPGSDVLIDPRSVIDYGVIGAPYQAFCVAPDCGLIVDVYHDGLDSRGEPNWRKRPHLRPEAEVSA